MCFHGDAVGSMCHGILLMGLICMAFWVACLGIRISDAVSTNELTYMSECFYFQFSGNDEIGRGM